MSSAVVQFNYAEMIPGLGAPGRQPYAPIPLTYQNITVSAHGLVDSGATTNVLPFDLGVELGLNWSEQKTVLRLTGNLAKHESRAVLLTATVHDFTPVTLAFAWTQAPHVPLILGQVSFFSEFDICFFWSREVFEIRPRSTGV